MNKDLVIIGVVGGSGSGKSLLSKTIVDKLEEVDEGRVSVVSEDHYYKDNSHLQKSQLAEINYDHPDAFEHSLLKEHISKLKNKEDISVPTYNHATHSRIENSLNNISGQTNILILEGIMLFNDSELRNMMNIKIFMDTPLDLCFIRRLMRDQDERGRSVSEIITQYINTVRPMYMQFIEPTKRFADIIIPHGGKNKIAIDIINSKIKQLLDC